MLMGNIGMEGWRKWFEERGKTGRWREREKER
jgi:hypothetical protein